MNRRTLLIFFLFIKLLALATVAVTANAWEPPSWRPIGMNEVFECENVTYNDQYVFYGGYVLAGRTYYISINPDQNTDLDLYLYDNNGNLINQSTTSGYDAAEQIKFTAAYDGYYYFKVQYVDGDSDVGYFSISLTDSLYWPPEPDPDNCSNNGGGDDDDDCDVDCDPPFSCPDLPIAHDICCALAGVYCNTVGVIEKITDAINSLKNAIVDTFNSIVNGIKNFFGAIKDAIVGFASGIVNAIKSIVNGVRDIILGIAEGIRSFFVALADGINSFINAIAQIVKNAVGGVIYFFEQAIEAFINAIETLLNSISSGLGDTIGAWLSDNGVLTLGLALTVIGLLMGAMPLTGLGVILVVAGLIQRGTLEWWMLAAGAAVLLIAAGVARR
ncbi:MAG: pre-peptidase C-terminal domain-containing protein [Desulfurococcales archaeon]|nr:pre-peptidase C-terminal domain-containing protein [Desulfurococcales archaeon]